MSHAGRPGAARCVGGGRPTTPHAPWTIRVWPPGFSFAGRPAVARAVVGRGHSFHARSVLPSAGTVPCRGPGLELAPVAQLHPPATRPELQPLRPDVLQRGFTLQPGRYQLSEVRAGCGCCCSRVRGSMFKHTPWPEGPSLAAPQAVCSRWLKQCVEAALPLP